MHIIILTVNFKSIPELEKKYSFLIQNNENTLQIYLGERATGYTGRSDRNNSVIKSIYQNTKNAVCSIDKEFALVFQEDALWDCEISVLHGIKIAQRFMENSHQVDLFMLGYHPNASFKKTKIPNAVQMNKAIHWQSVVFRKSLFEKYPNIPYGIHNDFYIATKMKNDVLCYGLSKSLVRQNTSRRLLRKFEYSFFYHTRCKFPKGDPINLLPFPIFISLSIFFWFFVNYCEALFSKFGAISSFPQ